MGDSIVGSSELLQSDAGTHTHGPCSNAMKGLSPDRLPPMGSVGKPHEAHWIVLSEFRFSRNSPSFSTRCS